MFLLRRPEPLEVRRFLERQERARLSHPAPGLTRDERAPPGFNFDHRRVTLGSGEACFRRAQQALRAWRMFALGWVSIHDPQTPILPGINVAIIVRVFGVWAINAARIEYVIDEPRRFGFGYGTLEDHFECGEERFLVEHCADDSVVYALSAFSRPNHPLVWLGYPLARREQKRFARDSCAAMKNISG